MEVFGNKMSYNIYYGAVDSDLTHFSNPNPASDYHNMPYKCLIRGENVSD